LWQKIGLEGIVSKRLGSPYRDLAAHARGSGPSSWQLYRGPPWLTAAKAIEQKSSRRLEYRWLYSFVMTQFLDEGLSARVF
jgi:hypothetical protein